MLNASRKVGLAALLLAMGVFYPGIVRAQVAPVSTAVVNGAVVDANGAPVSAATVVLSGSRTFTTETDAGGHFAIVNVPFGIYRIAVTSKALGAALREHVEISADVNIAIAYDTTLSGMKVIARTTSNANAAFNVTPASIASVSPLDAAFKGQTVWRNILEQIPGVSIGDLGGGFYNVSGVPGSPFNPIQVSVNGGLPYETATLFDGMPLIGAADSGVPGYGTDLEYYPLNGFGGADVVRGPGASSATIVDSIGGSLVLHAPSAASGDHFELSLSNDRFGGGDTTMHWAARFNKLSVSATYGFWNSPGPFPLPNAYMATEATPPATINGRAFDCYTAPTCFGPSPQNGGYQNAYALGGTGFLGCCFPINSSWTQHTGSLSLGYEITSSIHAQIYWSGQSNLGNQGTTPYWTTLFTPPVGYTGGLPGGIYYLPNAVAPQSYNSSTATSLLEEKLSARIGNGYLQLAALQNRNWTYLVYSTPHSASSSTLFGGGDICSNTSPNCSTGTYNPVIFNGGKYTVTYPNPFWSLSNSGVNNRDMLASYDVSINDQLAAGASYVKSYYNNPDGYSYAENLPGIGCFTGASTLPDSVSESTGETRIHLDLTPSRHLSIGLSEYLVDANYHIQNPNDPARFIDLPQTYSAPRLGAIWRPTSTVAIRASAGGGIALAPLYYIGYDSNNSPVYCTGGICTATLPNLKLQPEHSFGFDLGTDIRLKGSMIVSFDVYRSNLYGQVFGSVTTGTYLGQPLYTTQYQNLGVSRYEGILLDLRHDVPVGTYWHFSGGLTHAYVVSVPGGFYNGAGCTMCANLYVVPGINFNGGDNGAFGGAAVPYSQATAAVGYRWTPQKYVELAPVYYGSNNSYYRPAFVEVNATVSYPLSKQATASLNFVNITNIYGGNVATRSLANIMGAPTISGPPFANWGQEYGPRSIIGTLNFHI